MALIAASVAVPLIRRKRHIPSELTVALLRRWVPDIADRDVYVCGPQAWTDAVRTTLTAAGLPAARLHVETFGW